MLAVATVAVLGLIAVALPARFIGEHCFSVRIQPRARPPEVVRATADVAGYLREGASTFLTLPAWYVVYSAEEFYACTRAASTRGPRATGRQMAGEASEALTRTPPDCLGDTSVPGDRTHPGPISWPLGSERVRTPLVRLRRTCALRPILTRRRRRFGMPSTS